MRDISNIMDTLRMIDQQHLDIRTITMGISLLDCVSEDPRRCCDKIYDKITRRAANLVRTGENIESEFGIPIVNKRISVTPMALVAGSCDTKNYVPFALAMDRAAKDCGGSYEDDQIRRCHLRFSFLTRACGADSRAEARTTRRAPGRARC